VAALTATLSNVQGLAAVPQSLRKILEPLTPERNDSTSHLPAGAHDTRREIHGLPVFLLRLTPPHAQYIAMRIVFCGSGTFALPTLETLSDSDHDLLGVVTQPPRPAGRGRECTPTPVQTLAEQRGVDVLPTPDINQPEAVTWLADRRPDVLVVVEFGQFLKTAVRETARLDAINLHGSVLPKLRGAGPVNWAIIRGFERTGVSTFSLVDKMDAGAIYLSAETPIEPHERAGELRKRLAALGPAVVLQTLEVMAAGAAPEPQDHEAASYAPLLKKSDGYIDWARPAREIVAQIRGTWPWPGAQAVFERSNGKQMRVAIERAEVVDGPADGEPGCVDAEECIATGDGRLRILDIKPAGKRLMAWGDFHNGYRVEPGQRFSSIGEHA
jgi:methionyl-tRNA formyltransferase